MISVSHQIGKLSSSSPNCGINGDVSHATAAASTATRAPTSPWTTSSRTAPLLSLSLDCLEQGGTNPSDLPLDFRTLVDDRMLEESSATEVKMSTNHVPGKQVTRAFDDDVQSSPM